MSPEELPRRVRNRFQFLLERFFVRGAQYRLLVIAGMIVLLSVLGGMSVMVVSHGFDSSADAAWWAFLRLSDPGYLGDDEGLWKRTVSTILTVLGYVVFLGALVATMTQWLNATLERLHLGLTPVRMRDHVAILGWSERTPELIREMLLSEGRLRGWLAPGRVRRLRLAVLADRVTPALVQELKDELGRAFNPSQIILRSGSPLRVEHLDRVDVAHASAVVVPGSEQAGARIASQDAKTIKVLLTLSAMLRQTEEPLPTFVGELYDHRTVRSARGAYPGRVELVATEGLVGRMLAGCLRKPGLSSVHRELLTHGVGSSLYIRDDHPFGGRSWDEVAESLPKAVALGVVRGGDVILNPSPEYLVTEGDQLVALARQYADTDPGDAPTDLPAPAVAPISIPLPSISRILILGWNRKAPSLLAELDRHGRGLRVDIVSRLDQAERIADIQADGVTLHDLEVEHVVGDYTQPGVIGDLAPDRYDRILLLSSEWLATRDEADARTIASYLLLSDLLEGTPHRPDVLVELTDPDDAALLSRYPAEVLATPRAISHILAQVVLRQELHDVIFDLLGGGGPDVRLAPAGLYDLLGEHSFAAIARTVRLGGHTAMGVRLAGSGAVHLNPDKSERFDLGEHDSIVVVA